MVQQRAWDILNVQQSKVFTYSSRALQAGVFLIVAAWAVGPLGGLRFSPTASNAEGANDTSQLFNWHPILMTFAFVVCMGEGVLAYRAPIFRWSDRSAAKLAHFALHTTAAVSMTLGFIAVYKAHTLKKPQPMSDFYSVHSWLGITTFTLFAVQWVLGLLAFLAPRWTPHNRAAFAPLHGILGLSTFLLGLTTVAAGLQEKATFMQLAFKAGIRSTVMTMPVAAAVLLAVYAVVAMYHFSPSAAPRSQGQHVVVEGTPLAGVDHLSSDADAF